MRWLAAVLWVGFAPAAALAETGAETDEGGWVKPEAEELRAVYGLRFVVRLSEPETLDVHPSEWATPFISADGGLIYVGTDSGVLYAVWNASGRVEWKRKDLGQLGRGMGQVGDVLLAGGGNMLYGLEGYSGREQWKIDLGGVVGGPIVTTGTIAVIPVRPNGYAAIDGTSGEVLWRIKRPKPEGITVRGQAGPVIDRPRDRVYLGTSDGFLLAASLVSGELAWSVRIAAPSTAEPFADVDTDPAVVQGGAVVVAASYNGGVSAVEAATGKVLWKRDDIHHITDLAEVPAARWLVASIGDGQVAGIDPSNGQIRWRYKLQRGVPSRAIPLEGGFVAVASTLGPVAILEALSGRPVQLVTPGSGASADPFARGKELVVWTNKGHLLALRFGEGTGVSR